MLRIVLIFNKNLTNKKIVGMHSIWLYVEYSG